MVTIDEAIKHAEEVAEEQDKLCKRYDDASGYTRSHNEDIRTTDAKKCVECAEEHRQLAEWLKELKRFREPKIKIEETNFDQEQYKADLQSAFDCGVASVKPCEDAISRQAVLDVISANSVFENEYNLTASRIRNAVDALPPVTPQPKMRWCKDCKYFEYDSVAKVDGIPLIVAHEICSKWGDGCKTKEDGYCFLFEPQESEDK